MGITYRDAFARLIHQSSDIEYVEVIAENVKTARQLPAVLQALKRAGKKFTVHSLTLSLGSIERVDRKKLEHLNRLSGELEAEFVADHLAFCCAGALQSPHFLPIPLTGVQLDVLCENITAAQRALGRPFAVENVAALVRWPEDEMSEAEFLSRVIDNTGVGWLFDVANLYANVQNFHDEAKVFPWEQVVGCHIAGGVKRNGLYVDTHAHAISAEVLQFGAARYSRVPQGVPVIWERDENFPPGSEALCEIRTVQKAFDAGAKSAPGRAA